MAPATPEDRAAFSRALRRQAARGLVVRTNFTSGSAGRATHAILTAAGREAPNG